MADYLIPLILLSASVYGLKQCLPVYDLLVSGSAEGLKLVSTLLPTFVILLTAVSLLRTSGALEFLSQLAAPVMNRLGIPPETAILLLIRPISGSAALAVGTDLMAVYGVDSLIGRTAAVMLGSTETTFYTVSVYCGALGIRKTRYAIPAALMADLTGFLCAAWSVRIFT